MDLSHVARILADNPIATGMLLPLANATDRAYVTFLDQVKARWNIADFAPWDGPFVMARIEESISDLTKAQFPLANVEQILPGSVRGLGFTEQADRLHIYRGNHIPPEEMMKGGIQILLTSHPEMPAFGQTQNLGSFGMAFSKINLWEDGLHSYRVLLHESGHALHFVSVRTRYESLRNAFPPFFTEGIAIFFEGLLVDDLWLQTYTGMNPSDRKELRRLLIMQRLFVLRENLAFALLTHTLHALQPDQYPVAEQLIGKRLLYPDTGDKASLGHNWRYVPRWLRNDQSAEEIVESQWLAFTALAHVSEYGSRSCFTPQCCETLREFMSTVVWDEAMQTLIRKTPFEKVAAGLERDMAAP